MFKEKILSGEKCQTIRPWSEKRYSLFLTHSICDLYWKLRTKETEYLKSVKIISLMKIQMSVKKRVTEDQLTIRCFNFSQLNYFYMTGLQVAELIRNDGFDSLIEFLNFFSMNYDLEHQQFLLIRWVELEPQKKSKLLESYLN